MKKSTLIFGIIGFVLFTQVLYKLTELDKNFLNKADDAIFSQSIYQAESTGKLSNSIESAIFRKETGMLNHNGVHFQPILYLMIPLYKIFGTTLSIKKAQSSLMMLSLIPLFMLLNAIGAKQWEKILLGSMLIVSPIFLGNMTDIHPILLSLPIFFTLLYFIQSGNKYGIILATILLLSTKENIFPVIIMAAFWAATNKKFKTASVLAVIAPLHFAITTTIIIPSISGETYYFTGRISAKNLMDIFAKHHGIILLAAIYTLFLAGKKLPKRFHFANMLIFIFLFSFQYHSSAPWKSTLTIANLIRNKPFQVKDYPCQKELTELASIPAPNDSVIATAHILEKFHKRDQLYPLLAADYDWEKEVDFIFFDLRNHSWPFESRAQYFEKIKRITERVDIEKNYLHDRCGLLIKISHEKPLIAKSL